MKKMTWLILFAAWASAGAPRQPGNPTGLKLIAVLRTTPVYIQNAWYGTDYTSVVHELKLASAESGLTDLEILAMIYVESEFYPLSTGYNTNGTIDRGLSQQNSAYFQDRCLAAFGRYCSIWDLYDVPKSLRLMRMRFRECAEFNGSTERMVLCYNSGWKARNYPRTRNDRYLVKWREEGLPFVERAIISGGFT